MIRRLFSVTTLALATSAAELFTTNDSVKCMKECIDENNIWCPSANGESGTCCDDVKCNQVDFCSFNAPIDNKAL